MKEIILGIKDYLNDVKHDKMCLYISKVFDQYVCDDVGDEDFEFVETPAWKEGSVWHYIRQRKIANIRLKKRKGK